MNRQHDATEYSDQEVIESSPSTDITDEMLRKEEEEIAELERKRDEMEEEIKRMDMELGRNIRGYGAT